MSDCSKPAVLLLGGQCGFLFSSLSEALKDKFKVFEAEHFQERVLRELSITYRSSQIEYPQPRGSGHAARQKRQSKKRKNKSR